jgi:hypothetical protein
VPRHNGIELGPGSALLTPAKAKRLLQPAESDEQAMAMEALVGKARKGQRRTLGDGMTLRYPELLLLYAINPNKGGNRSKAGRGKGKAMGLLPDMPDLHLPVMRGPFIGLYIEMKRKGTYGSKDQRGMAAALRSEGHCVVECQTAQECVDAVVGYLSLPYNRPSVRPLGALHGRRIVEALARWQDEMQALLTPKRR